MRIIRLDYHLVEIEDDDQQRSSVFRGDNGRWKCLLCQRYRCEHAKFVQAENPVLPEMPVTPVEDLADLIDE